MSAAMYYIAIVAPDEINNDILQWKMLLQQRYGSAAALKSPAHITLVPPFWCGQELEQPIAVVLDEVAGTHHSFQITIRNFGSFPPKVIFAAVEHTHFLDDLETTLPVYLGKRSIPLPLPAARPFHPHITLATRDLQRKDFSAAWALFQNRKYEATFVADGLRLLKHDGSIWHITHRAPFVP